MDDLYLKNLEIFHPSKVLFRCQEFVIPSRPGITLLLGANGTGKTSLFRYLIGAPLGRADWYRHGQSYHCGEGELFSYLPQKWMGDPNLTLKEFFRISLGNESIYRQLCSLFEESHLKKRVSDLSGGELRKAFFKLVMAENRRFVLLDEPLSSLDILEKRKVIEEIREQSRQRRLILTTHEVDHFINDQVDCWVIKKSTSELLPIKSDDWRKDLESFF